MEDQDLQSGKSIPVTRKKPLSRNPARGRVRSRTAAVRQASSKPENAESPLKNVDRYFPVGSVPRERFDELSAKCTAEGLLSFSFIVCCTARRKPKQSVYEMWGTSAAELKDLPNELEELARKVDRVNTLMFGFMAAKITDNEQAPIPERARARNKMQVYRYLPKTLRVYAADLRIAFKWITENMGPRRYDSLRGEVLRMLQYIDECTGSPHYEHVADILSHLFPIFVLPGADPNQEIPALLSSSAALTRLYQRSAQRGFRHSRPDHSNRGGSPRNT